MPDKEISEQNGYQPVEDFSRIDHPEFNGHVYRDPKTGEVLAAITYPKNENNNGTTR